MPCSATSARSVTPVCFIWIRKTGVWKSDNKGTEQPCIQRHTASCTAPISSVFTNRLSETIEGQGATRVLTRLAYDSIAPLQRASRKPLDKVQK